MNLSPADVARFWMNVRPEARGYSTPCLIWQAGTNGRYGQFYLRTGPQRATRTGRIYAHRFAWLFAHGELPPPQIKVCHRCDETLCCNWDHMFTGTQADNLADMAHKERSANIKLTRTQRASIADRIERGESRMTLAVEHGVSLSLIHQLAAKRKRGLL